jgi:dihydropteroate synthase
MNGLAFKAWLRRYDQAESISPLVMGILNFTPDSFSDGTKYFDLAHACARVQEMIQQGVDLIDIGAESSRPGAHPVSAEIEAQRLLPLIERIRSFTDICISVDTHKPQVMSQVLKAGADWINDIFALREPGAIDVIVTHDVPVCLMHIHGRTSDFGHEIDPGLDVNQQVLDFFHQRLEILAQLGVKSKNLMIDPGIGFGKNTGQNLSLIKSLYHLKTFGLPIVLGVSRKRFIGDVLMKDVSDRQIGSISANLIGMMHGARILRTHDVAETKEMLKMAQAIMAVDI